MALDRDVQRLAEDYVRRQCSYMALIPPEEAIQRAAQKIYRVLMELKRAKARTQVRL